MSSLKPKPLETTNGLILLWVGTAIFAIGLVLPALRARFSPPNGYQVLEGHRIDAFSLNASGWQFAKAAPESRLSVLMIVLAGAALLRTVVALTSQRGIEIRHLGAADAVSRVIHGFISGVIALGWILALGVLTLLANTPIVRTAVPLTGRAGVLPTFEHPLSPQHTVESHWFTISPEIGMAVLAVGIVLSLVSLGKYAPLSIAFYVISVVVLALVHHIFHQPTIDSVCHRLQTLLLVT